MKLPEIKLARREKIMVASGACCLVFFLLLHFIVLPVFSSKAKFQRNIEVARDRIDEMVRLRREYEGIKGNSGGVRKALAGRSKGFTLFSLLEKMATRAGLKDRIKYIKPSTSQAKGDYKVASVEMQFEGITMRELFNYLYRIEDPKNVLRIKRLSIRKHKEKDGYVDATLQVSTVQLA